MKKLSTSIIVLNCKTVYAQLKNNCRSIFSIILILCLLFCINTSCADNAPTSMHKKLAKNHKYAVLDIGSKLISLRKYEIDARRKILSRSPIINISMDTDVRHEKIDNEKIDNEKIDNEKINNKKTESKKISETINAQLKLNSVDCNVIKCIGIMKHNLFSNAKFKQSEMHQDVEPLSDADLKLDSNFDSKTDLKTDLKTDSKINASNELVEQLSKSNIHIKLIDQELESNINYQSLLTIQAKLKFENFSLLEVSEAGFQLIYRDGGDSTLSYESSKGFYGLNMITDIINTQESKGQSQDQSIRHILSKTIHKVENNHTWTKNVYSMVKIVQNLFYDGVGIDNITQQDLLNMIKITSGKSSEELKKMYPSVSLPVIGKLKALLMYFYTIMYNLNIEQIKISDDRIHDYILMYFAEI